MISLGALYSSFEESILPGMRFWPDRSLKSHSEVIYHPKQKTFWTAPSSYEEKLEMFGIEVEGSVGLSTPVGKITKATGKLSFLRRVQVQNAIVLIDCVICVCRILNLLMLQSCIFSQR